MIRMAATLFGWRATSAGRDNPTVLEVVLSGLVTGWAIAIPIGAVGALLVALTARTSLRVGSSAALGVAVVDGGYAALAVVGGAAIAGIIEPYADGLRVASALVLLAIAVLTVLHAWRRAGSPPAEARPLRAWQAFTVFLAITVVNPTTVVYFAAVVLGNPHLTDGFARGCGVRRCSVRGQCLVAARAGRARDGAGPIGDQRPGPSGDRHRVGPGHRCARRPHPDGLTLAYPRNAFTAVGVAP